MTPGKGIELQGKESTLPCASFASGWSSVSFIISFSNQLVSVHKVLP